jgi:alginate O-acetyltransferase complex protein AlgI
MWPVIRQATAFRPAPHRQYAPIPVAAQAQGRGKHLALYQGEPEACRRDLWQILPILAHLGLLLAVFKVFRVEGRAFQMLVTFALAALPVHYLLPYRWKKVCFLAVSIAGLTWVFGLAATGCVLALASVLIGVCYLPVAWLARTAILAALGLGLGLLRPHSAITGIPDLVWPVLASIFMFRIIIYMYELKHAKTPEPLIDTLSYFFLLPNACFQLFPVVDYRTFRRGYFARDIHAIQRSGLRMMFNGTIHLLLYRVVYDKLWFPAEEVQGPASLAAFLVWNYLRYLRVSGQFHMACGLLQLFGHQLPETHHHYLLATGFTDYWRRINIYWKDFMVRIVFNPVAFRLKRWPQPAALAVATIAVFLTTWLLHGYQSYWLQGTWGFSIPDAVFWGILGVLVLVNVQIDARARRPRPRDPDRGAGIQARSGGFALRPFAIRGVQIAATFTTIVVLWSLWTSPGIAEWLDMMRRGIKL